MEYLVRQGKLNTVHEERLTYDPIMESKGLIITNKTSTSELLEKVVQNPRKYAIIRSGLIPMIEYLYMDMNGFHKFHVSKETLSLSLSGLFFKKNSLYQEALNFEMMKLWEEGLIQNIDNRIAFRYTLRAHRMARENNRQPPVKSNKFKLVHMTAGLTILAVGFIMALISLCFEYILPKVWVEKYKTLMREHEEPKEESNGQIQIEERNIRKNEIENESK